ncbi:MAG: shikimate kinase [Clostridiaceae bacterium]|nr:shikimate kinase [Clostridiaceae bacterium]
MQLQRHIFLIGFMGVGKTSTSRQLSKKLKTEEIDTDAMIVQQEGKSISAIFEDSGEACFRDLETKLLDQIADRKPCIVSCGGGMAMRQTNVEKMKACGTVIFLTAEPETIYSHVKDSRERPLLNGNMNVAYIGELMGARTPKYQAAADISVATDGLNPEQVADIIIREISKVQECEG